MFKQILPTSTKRNRKIEHSEDNVHVYIGTSRVKRICELLNIRFVYIYVGIRGEDSTRDFQTTHSVVKKKLYGLSGGNIMPNKC